VLERGPVDPPAWDAASALLHARLTPSDLDDLRRHRGGDYLALWEVADEAQRRRIDLIWAAHLGLAGPLASTGLVAGMPPSDVHAMAQGPLAAGGDHALADVVLGALETSGLTLDSRSAVLDFGSSSGRVTRVLAAARPEVTWLGCDPNEQAIAWAQEHLPMAAFFRSPQRPPLDLADGALDAVFAVSIWSHFAQDAALAWLEEMHRVVRPGGRLLLTTHALQSVALDVASGRLLRPAAREAVAAMLRGEHHFVDVWGAEGDWGVVDPSWGDAWFTSEWLAARATPGWSLRLHVPGGLDGNQDLMVLERDAPRTRPARAGVVEPRVSAVIRLDRRPEQVARLVRLVAPHVDEVVVAAAQDVDEAGLALVADAQPEQLLRLPAGTAPGAAEAFLTSRVDADWILRLDGDDVPSAALLRDLRRLVRDPETVALRLPRRWVWPDGERFLAQRPWWPDAQVRLVRTTPGAVHDDGGPRPLGPWHDAEQPLLHLDLVRSDRAQRERRVADAPADLPPIDGLSPFVAYYLPEAHPVEPRTQRLDAADRAVLAYVLDGTGEAPPEPRGLRRRRPATDVPVVPAAEVEAARPTAEPPAPVPLAVTEGVRWDPGRARVRLEAADLDARAATGVPGSVRARLHHEGALDLSDAPQPGVRVRARWDGAAEEVLTGLSARVRPGDARVLDVAFAAPAASGAAVLLLDVVDGQDRPLGATLRLALEVRPSA